MKYLSSLLLSLLFLSSYAQKEVKLEELKGHIGDSVEVRGRVYGVRYLQTAKKTPTIIDIGGAYPNQLLTVVIWGDVREQLPYMPEKAFKTNEEIIIFGKVDEYKGKPQITVRNPDQVVFIFI